MAQSSIEWTELTWNPTTGCTKVSQGCKNCYAEVMARRLQAMGVEKYQDGFAVRTHESALKAPYTWSGSKIVFVNSMSDLFHEDIPLDFIQRVFFVMNDNPQHVFQVLTKRTERLLELSDKLEWGPNIWMGTSVEDQKVLDRIEHLRTSDAQVKFLSCEPLLGPLPALNLQNIDWVIVGGESGHKARPMKEEWAEDIQEQCENAEVSFFFKQWGTYGADGVKRNKKANGRQLFGREWNEQPVVSFNL